MVQLNVEIDDSMNTAVAVYCSLLGMKKKELVAEALKARIEAHEAVRAILVEAEQTADV